MRGIDFIKYCCCCYQYLTLQVSNSRLEIHSTQADDIQAYSSGICSVCELNSLSVFHTAVHIFADTAEGLAGGLGGKVSLFGVATIDQSSFEGTIIGRGVC